MRWKTSDKIVLWGVFCVVMGTFDFIIRGPISIASWVLFFGVGCAIAACNWRFPRWCKTVGEVLFWVAFAIVTAAIFYYTVDSKIKGRFSFWDASPQYIIYGFGVCMMVLSRYMKDKRRGGERVSSDLMMGAYAVAVFVTCTLLFVSRIRIEEKRMAERRALEAAIEKHIHR